MVCIDIWGFIGIVGIVISIASLFWFLGGFFAKRKPEWDNNARIIKKIVYEEGIHQSVNESKGHVERCSSHNLSSGIDKNIMFNCILREKTRDSLTELEEQLIGYNKAQSLAVKEIRIIVEHRLAEDFSDLKEKVDSGSIKIMNADSLVKVFTVEGYLHGIETLLQYTLEEKISYNFYVDNYSKVILEIQKHSDESALRAFFEKLNKDVQSMDPLFFFKREKKSALNKIDTAIEALEKDEKNLSSFKKFWYGWRKEEDVIKLNQGIEERNKLAECSGVVYRHS